MTLQEFIDTLEPTKEFMIGAKTSYFFGGTREQYEAEIDRIYNEHIAKTKDELERAKITKEKTRCYIKKRNNNKRVSFTYEYDRSRADEDDYRLEIRRTLCSAKDILAFYQNVDLNIRSRKTIDICEEEIKKPRYRDREILEHYKSIANEDIELIIVDGIQIGLFADIEEARRARCAR